MTEPDTREDLLAAVSPPDGVLSRLRTRLAQHAADEGVLEVAYRCIPSPVGDLLVAATVDGVLEVAYLDVRGLDVALQRLADVVSPRILEGSGRLDPVARQLDEYFAGRRRGFDLPLDLRLVSGFRRTVVAHLPAIPHGTTASYGQVARDVGNPRAARAVGTACATNPIPIIVPCHRVVRSDGSPGRYAGGEQVKLQLLELEAQAPLRGA